MPNSVAKGMNTVRNLHSGSQNPVTSRCPVLNATSTASDPETSDIWDVLSDTLR